MTNIHQTQDADAGTPLEVPAPVLFNTFKHHAGALRVRIAQATKQGERALLEMADRVVVLGTKLMDLYIGPLAPAEIGRRVLDILAADGRLERSAFRAWIEQQGGYVVVTFPAEGSNWVLRAAEESDRYVHLHPGRWSPATVRVRANVLKTAFLVLIHTGIHGGNPMDREVVNQVRGEYLDLEPLGRDLEGEMGLGSVIEILRGERE
jgi:hypothetical protein